MQHLNQVLSRIAPWIWIAESLMAVMLLSRAWRICYSYAKAKKATSVTAHVQRVTGLLSVFAVGMVLVGAVSLLIQFSYPELQQSRYVVPLLFQISQLSSLLIFLGLPGAFALVGYWKIRFLLTDT